MSLVRADAIALPLADESVDLVVTSPPYFALRSYTDGGEHYDGQIGSEDTPRAFLEALWAVTAECKRVLKPTGSMFVNLGDKYAGSGGHNNAGISDKSTLAGNGHQGGGPKIKATRRQSPDSYNQAADVRNKSLMGLPWLYALGCTGALAGVDGTDPGLDLILRAEIVWSKRNGLPESVKDRVRRTHEQWFHLTKEGAYFGDTDTIRVPHTGGAHASGANAAVTSWESGQGETHRTGRCDPDQFDPRGKLPGSVWEMASEPLLVPEHLDVDHFAAFPTEWPRRFVLGWSPTGICTTCDQARVPVVDVEQIPYRNQGATTGRPKRQDVNGTRKTGGFNTEGYPQTTRRSTVTGYACGCPDDTAPTRPAVVLDPFGGTGTTAMVANALGRYGISVDLSADYLRLARWRIHESGHARKAIARTWQERQGALL